MRFWRKGWRKRQYAESVMRLEAQDSGPFFDHVRSISFFGAIPEARRRRPDGLAGLRKVIPDVRFARIKRP
jgi:hypothetical protein